MSEKFRTTIYLSKDLHKIAKILAAEEDKNLSEIITKLLKAYVKMKKKEKEEG